MNPNIDPKKLLDAIFKTAVDSIIVIDSKGIIQFVNRSSILLFGYSEEELYGQNISILMPNPYAREHDNYIGRYLHTGEKHIIGIGREVYGQRKDGSTFPLRLSVSEVLLSECGERYFTGIIHDITNQRNREEQINKLNAELEVRIEERTEKLAEVVNKLLETNKNLQLEIQQKKAVAQALRLSQADLEKALLKERELGELKSRFVTTASHEFRTPLSTILSSASLITRYIQTEDNDKRTKHILRIKSAVNNLTDILNDFLSLSKLEEGKLENKPDYFDLCDLCAEVIEEMQVFAKPNQIIQHQHTGNTQPVFLDRHFTKNILINLVSNALKYSEEGKTVNLNTTINTEHIILVVQDEGLGIPEEEQEHLFERFFRAKNVTNIQGTGLGLNIVRRYIELMNGSIYFTSQYQQGSTFTVQFPITTY